MKAEWVEVRGIEWGSEKLYLPNTRAEMYLSALRPDRIYAVIWAKIDHCEISWKRAYTRRHSAIRGIWRTLRVIRANAMPGSRQWNVATRAMEALNEAEAALGNKTWPVEPASAVTKFCPTAAQGNTENAESQVESWAAYFRGFKDCSPGAVRDSDKTAAGGQPTAGASIDFCHIEP